MVTPSGQYDGFSLTPREGAAEGRPPRADAAAAVADLAETFRHPPVRRMQKAGPAAARVPLPS
eukprot:366416-Chlamydomonas_euryale.AAC.5